MDDLIKRLEAAEAGSRGLDGRIAWELGWRFNGFVWDRDQIGGPDTVPDFDEWPNIGGSWKQPGDQYFYGDVGKQALREGEAEGRWEPPANWTTSIDAAVALVERVLPGWVWLKKTPNTMTVFQPPRNEKEWAVHFDAAAPSPALALCIAVLTALKEQPDDNG